MCIPSSVSYLGWFLHIHSCTMFNSWVVRASFNIKVMNKWSIVNVSSQKSRNIFNKPRIKSWVESLSVMKYFTPEEETRLKSVYCDTKRYASSIPALLMKLASDILILIKVWISLLLSGNNEKQRSELREMDEKQLWLYQQFCYLQKENERLKNDLANAYAQISSLRSSISYLSMVPTTNFASSPSTPVRNENGAEIIRGQNEMKNRQSVDTASVQNASLSLPQQQPSHHDNELLMNQESLSVMASEHILNSPLELLSHSDFPSPTRGASISFQTQTSYPNNMCSLRTSPLHVHSSSSTTSISGSASNSTNSDWNNTKKRKKTRKNFSELQTKSYKHKRAGIWAFSSHPFVTDHVKMSL